MAWVCYHSRLVHGLVLDERGGLVDCCTRWHRSHFHCFLVGEEAHILCTYGGLLTSHGAYLWYREWTGSDWIGFFNPWHSRVNLSVLSIVFRQLRHPVDPTGVPLLQNRSLKLA